MHSIGSLFSLPHGNSERFKPYTTSSPKRLKSILHKSEWNNFQQKQQFKPLPKVEFLSIHEKMERLKKLIGFTLKDTKHTPTYAQFHFDSDTRNLAIDRETSLTGIVRTALASSSLFSTPLNNDNNFCPSVDSGFRPRNNTVSTSEIIITPRMEESSSSNLYTTQTIQSNGIPSRRSNSSSLPNVNYQWRQQKYIDEKENRMKQIKVLESELENRECSRHNRKINEYGMRRLLLQVEGLRLERRELPREEFPELPYNAKKIIQIVWNRSAPQNEVFSSDAGVDITRKDLLTLFGTEWLNDEVINFYINLLVNRSKNDKRLPKVYAFNTFFYQNLCQKGFSGVKRWTRKVNIFDHEIILVPIHLGNHWCMTVIDLEQRKIDYYDSLMGDNFQCLESLKQYLIEESMDKRKRPFDMTGWNYTCRKDIPHQQNLWDCGMFSCLFAESASRRATIKFTQQHIPYFRERIVYEILKKELL